jgi:AbrB family looped-hinge helix DNA binding protein
MEVSTLTRKGQVTIPAEIRKILDLHPGDKIGFTLSHGEVILQKITPFDYEYHKAVENTLSEWSSAADEEAYSLPNSK